MGGLDNHLEKYTNLKSTFRINKDSDRDKITKYINDYLHYTLLISEYFTYLILKKINFNHFNNIFGATFIEITSDIINFNIS